MPFKPNFKTLPKSQRQTWGHLSPAKDMGFCLYGGTALALRFGHRESVDFNFFSAGKLDKSLIIKRLQILDGAIVLQETPDSYVALAKPPGETDTVKIAFFGEMDFGRVGISELSADGVLLAASVRDLMATKLKALFDRIEAKDYIDIAEMLRRGVGLTDGICDALALYPSFSAMYCLKSLCYFDQNELAGVDGKCRSVLSKAATSVLSTTQKFLPSSTISPSLVLSAKDMAAELALVASPPPCPAKRKQDPRQQEPSL